MQEIFQSQKPTRKSHSNRTCRQALSRATLEALEMRQLLSGAVVSIAALDNAAAEASLATGKFRLTRDDTEGALDVTVAISGTGTNGTDYNSIGTTVSFADGIATADVTVTPKEDSTYEGSETVILTVTDGDDYDVDAEADAATVTIADNEKPTISIEATDSTAAENDDENTATFTISRDGPTDGALTVKLTVAGTGTNGTDYNTVATTATIPDGEESVEVTVTGKDDSTLEGTETVKLTIAADATKYNISSTDKEATVNLADDEVSTVKITAADATATEGIATDTGKFTLTRTGTGAAIAAALDVTITIAGTATNGTDYDTVSTTVTIPAGKATADVTIKTKADTDVELGETVKVTIAEPEDDSYLVDGTYDEATVNLKDDDKPTVSLEAFDATASETGFANTGKFKVSRTGATSETLTVAYAISGTATKGTDYKAPAATVTIPVGKSFVYVEVKPKDDLALEGTETVIATLSAGTSYIVGSTKTGTVTLSEDELPEVSIKATDATASEPGTDKGTFTITRTGTGTAIAAALAVDLDIDGTATAEDDYTTFNDSVTIPAGKSSVTISIAPVSDTALEGSETVVVGLAASDGYDVDVFADEATVTIKDDEKSTVTIVATDASAAEAGSATGTFTISRTGSGAAIADDMKVVLTLSGTATKPTDYAAFDTTVTIPAGMSSKTITVTPVDDSAAELAETVILTLAANAAYTVGTDKTGTVTIAENDKPTVSISSKDRVAKEGTTDVIVLTVSRTGVTAALEVDLIVSGSAAGADFTSLPTSVTIPVGKSFVSVTLVANDDSTYEGTESLLIGVSSGEDYEVDENADFVTGTITDKQLPTVSLEASDAAADEEDNAVGVFTLTRGGPTTDAVVVNYTISGTAKNGKDYTKIAKTVTIPAGEESVDVPITPRTDTAVEGSETVILTLAKGSYTIDEDATTGTVTIADEQSPTISVEAVESSVDENSSTGARFRIWRTGVVSGTTLEVDFALAGTAAIDDDYTIVDEEGSDVGLGTVTIAAGESYVDIYVKPVDNSTDAADKTVKLTLADGSTYAIDGDNDEATITIADDDLSSSLPKR